MNAARRFRARDHVIDGLFSQNTRLLVLYSRVCEAIIQKCLTPMVVGGDDSFTFENDER